MLKPIFILEIVLKVVFIILGILVWKGMKWAFIVFLVVMGVVLMTDIALLVGNYFKEKSETQKTGI